MAIYRLNIFEFLERFVPSDNMRTPCEILLTPFPAYCVDHNQVNEPTLISL